MTQAKWAYEGNDMMHMFNSNPKIVKNRVNTMIENNLRRIFNNIPSNAEYQT